MYTMVNLGYNEHARDMLSLFFIAIICFNRDRYITESEFDCSVKRSSFFVH